MKILTRYIASAYLKILGLCISAFVTIYLVIDFLDKINRFTRAHGKPQYIVLFFIAKIPEIVTQVMPLGILMATLLSLGLLSRNSEIIAMRGCGISLKKITAPILTIALLSSLLTLFVNEVVVTRTAEKMKYIEDVLIQGKSPNTFFRQNNIWYRENDFILQAKLFDPSAQTLRGVTLWQTRGRMQPVKQMEADNCVWTDPYWMLHNVVVRDIAVGNIPKTMALPAMPVMLKLKLSDLRVLDQHADNIGIYKLWRYCRNLEKSGYDPTRYVAQMHAKISLPFASFIMAFLGIPFVLRNSRSSSMAFGIGMSIAIGFTYYIINAILLSFGQTGVLPPFVSAWAANLIFALSGVWLTMTLNN
jgi:lipopolysaccharide export system permease protein